MNKHSSIEILEARIAPATFAVTDGGNSGAGTLRQAIINANATAGHDTIDLQVDDIEITTALPAITEDVTISSDDAAAVISGNAKTVNINGLTFTGASTGSILRDFTLSDFRGDMLTLSDGGSDTITDVTFYASVAVAGTGKDLVITSPHNNIDGNFFQNDGTQAIYISGAGAGGNTIQDNEITSGTVDLGGGNIFGGSDGLAIVGAPNNVITENTFLNVAQNGLHISGVTATGNVIHDNLFGVRNFPNIGDLPVGANGILIEDAPGNSIGGTNPGQGNNFANCGLSAVQVTGSTAVGNTILGNFFSAQNTGLPIDLGGDGATPNDPSPDADTGPNHLQNTPIITQAVALSGNSYTIGELHSAPNTTYLIQLFGTIASDDGSDGRIDASFSVTTDANGLATFIRDLPQGLYPDGSKIFATATSGNGTGETSEAAQVTFATGTELVHLTGLHTATYTDADGDPVKITATNGTFDFDNFDLIPSGKGAHLETLTLDAGFNRASVAIVASKTRGGDGFANVGTIAAAGTNLDALTVDGDLGRLSIGRAGITQSLDQLTVHSLGVIGGVNSPGVFAAGGIGGISVLADVKDASIDLHGGLYRDLTVKGSLNHLDFSAYTLGSLNVAHDVMNSDLTAERGAIGNITVGGSILDTTDGSGIHAATTIGAILVKHEIASTGTGRISITAGGLLHPAVADTSLTIRSLKTGGDVTHTDILAGYDAQLDPINRSVHVGALAIGGNWMGSNAVAGAASGADGFFGTGDDLAIADGTVGNLSRIASIVIKGTVTGGGGAQYGFVAEQIGSFKFGKTTLPLTNGQDDLPVGSALDVHVREV